MQREVIVQPQPQYVQQSYAPVANYRSYVEPMPVTVQAILDEPDIYEKR